MDEIYARMQQSLSPTCWFINGQIIMCCFVSPPEIQYFWSNYKNQRKCLMCQQQSPELSRLGKLTIYINVLIISTRLNTCSYLLTFIADTWHKPRFKWCYLLYDELKCYISERPSSSTHKTRTNLTAVIWISQVDMQEFLEPVSSQGSNGKDDWSDQLSTIG